MKYSSIRDKIGLCAALIPLSLYPHDVAQAAVTVVISVTEDLHFGSLDVNGTDALVINTSGVRDPGGTLTNVTLIAGAGLERQAKFTLSGSTGLAISVDVSPTSLTVSNGTGQNMVIDSFNLVTDAGGPNELITLATNPETFDLGATLNVTSGQAEGTYSGSFTLNANYM